MLRQVDRLAGDLRSLPNILDPQLADLAPIDVRQVVLIGDGDSFHAALAAELAMATFADLTCTAESALQFAEYGVERLDRLPPAGALVVGVSASGRTERVVQALDAAATHGARTMAVTGVAASPLVDTARSALVVTVPELEPSPGIRTYQASLLGLLSLAIHIGRMRGVLESMEADATRAELAALPDQLHATNEGLRHPCERVAGELRAADPIAVTGSGPNYGTARYVAAKLTEGAGVLAVGQDLEEWCHVERFAHPLDMPVLVLAAPGRASRYAVRTAQKASAAGRRVIAVAPPGSGDLTGYAHLTLPISAVTREEFSPLLYHSVGSILAAGLAARLGRRPFLG